MEDYVSISIKTDGYTNDITVVLQSKKDAVDCFTELIRVLNTYLNKNE